jgi:hypothetical protein
MVKHPSLRQRSRHRSTRIQRLHLQNDMDIWGTILEEDSYSKIERSITEDFTCARMISESKLQV